MKERLQMKIKEGLGKEYKKYVKTNSTTASSAAYFSTDGGVTGNTNVLVNSVLYLTPSILGFKIDPTDDIVVHYLSKYP